MSSTVRYGVLGLLAALLAGHGLYWFFGGSAADHSTLRNAFVVLQIIVALLILSWSQAKLWKTNGTA
jgi:NAD-dependent oxidoreductase involved in siderophore biosynthesis